MGQNSLFLVIGIFSKSFLSRPKTNRKIASLLDKILSFVVKFSNDSLSVVLERKSSLSKTRVQDASAIARALKLRSTRQVLTCPYRVETVNKFRYRIKLDVNRSFGVNSKQMRQFNLVFRWNAFCPKKSTSSANFLLLCYNSERIMLTFD